MKKIIILPIIFCLFIDYCNANQNNSKLNDVAISSITNINSPFCYLVHVEYHTNGKIKEKGCQGFFDGQSIFVGDFYEYDIAGHLIRTTYFHPDKFGKDYKIIKEYNEQENIISKKIFNYDDLYGVDEEELNEIPQ